jgi:hypothetical protein
MSRTTTVTDFITQMTSDHNFESKRKKVKRLVEKWEKTGFLKGVPNKRKGNLAQLLENEALALKKLLQEQTYTSDIAGFTKVAFPIVRRVFANLLANEIVSVQPIDHPSGAIFYFDFTYNINKPGYTAGGSLYGNRETVTNPDLQGQGAILGTGGPYNLNTPYSRRVFQLPSATATYDSKTATSTWIAGTLSAFKFVMNAGTLTAMDRTAIYQIRVATSSNLVYETAPNASFRTLAAVEKLTTANAWDAYVDHTMTEFDGTNVTIWSASPFTGASMSAGNTVVIVGPARTYMEINKNFGDGVNSLGDFEAVDEIPEINIKIDSKVINAVTRKLKAVWTPEQAQDLEAMYQLDAEVELTQVLSEQIARDIDREILIDLLNAAAIKSAWSRKIGRYVRINDTTNLVEDVYTQSSFSPGTPMVSQAEWYQTLGETMIDVSNQIYKRNLRSGATWAITSPEVSTVFEAMQGFKPSSILDSTVAKFSMGVEKVGSIANRFDIYKDPYFPANKILLGFKGASVLESGYVYAPYVPLIVTPTLFHPDDFTPRKGVMTRYAKCLIRNDFYGVITVADLGVIGA